MKLINSLNIVIFISILALLVSFIVLKIISYSNRIKYTAEAFFESCEPCKNPYCGFYHIMRYTLGEDFSPIDTNAYTEQLVLIEINLKNYKTGKISEKGLLELNDILASWVQNTNGTKLILRFLYDWDGLAMVTEPDNIDIVLTHMEQISKFVNRYRDAVYIMQGAFIGNWGEMHNSKFSDCALVKQLIQRLNELIDPCIYLSVRTPSLWRAVNNLYTPQKKSPPFSLQNRLGLFNDGILGSETDLGTYGDTLKKDAASPCYKGTRKEELEFQNKLCSAVPNGGEVVYNNNLSVFENAVLSLKTMHISYLNADYDSRVFEIWKNSVWREKDAFYGCDGYSYVKAHLGYRYVIDGFKLKKLGFIKPCYALHLTIKNSGFSSALKELDTSVVIINEKTGECTPVFFNADLKSLSAGDKKTFTAKLSVKDLKCGSYLIYFSVKDKITGQTIFLGNKNEITKNGYLLGRLKK